MKHTSDFKLLINTYTIIEHHKILCILSLRINPKSIKEYIKQRESDYAKDKQLHQGPNPDDKPT